LTFHSFFAFFYSIQAMNNRTLHYWIENKQTLLKDYDKRVARYRKVQKAMVDTLNTILSSEARNMQVKGRIKKFEAFYQKLLLRSQEQIIDNPFDEIKDLIGIRITVPFLEDIQNVENIVRKNFSVLEVDYKHRELSVKEFGYDSTHFMIEIPEETALRFRVKETLSCEVQLRTILQDAWAEVEHELVYKTSLDKVEDTIRRKLTALNATLSLADITFQEIRDYQRKRYSHIQERHQQLLDKVSTVPEKMGSQYRDREEIPPIPHHPEEELSEENNVNDLFVAAINAHINNDLDRALEIYSHLILISPNHYLYNHRGLVYFSLSQYEEALKDFTTAIDIEPRDTRVYTNRGLTHRMLKQYDKALKDFEHSLELNPLWTDTFYSRALTYYDMGDLHGAIEDCDRAIALKTDFKQAVRFKQFLLNKETE